MGKPEIPYTGTAVEKIYTKSSEFYHVAKWAADKLGVKLNSDVVFIDNYNHPNRLEEFKWGGDGWLHGSTSETDHAHPCPDGENYLVRVFYIYPPDESVGYKVVAMSYGDRFYFRGRVFVAMRAEDYANIAIPDYEYGD